MNHNNTPTIAIVPHADKIVHASIYFILCQLLLRAFNKQHKLVILFFAIAYGIFIEWYQGHYTSDRSMDIWDAVANSLGAIIGVFL